MNLFTWHPMSELPTRSDTYLVGHRGVQKMMTFFADDREWAPGTVLGWHGDLKFGPTHWMGIPAPDATGTSHAARMQIIERANEKAACRYCRDHVGDNMMPPHKASDRCESGKHNHCTCDLCY